MGLRMIITANTASATFLVAKFLIFLLADPSPVCATNQVITLYSGSERTVTISERNVPDLRVLTFDFDNMAKGAQAQGIWILYEDYDYYGAFELISNTYKQLDDDIRGEVSSPRLVGLSDNYRASTVTFYQGIDFQGREKYNSADNSNLDGSASSLIVTGSEPWTVFASSNFEGEFACIYPFPDKVRDTNELGIHSIRSVRRGC